MSKTETARLIIGGDLFQILTALDIGFDQDMVTGMPAEMLDAHFAMEIPVSVAYTLIGLERLLHMQDVERELVDPDEEPDEGQQIVPPVLEFTVDQYNAWLEQDGSTLQLTSDNIGPIPLPLRKEAVLAGMHALVSVSAANRKAKAEEGN